MCEGLHRDTGGQGLIDLFPWIPVNNVQGLKTPTRGQREDGNTQTKADKGREETMRTNQALFYKYNMRSQSKRHSREVSHTTNRCFLHVSKITFK